MNFLKILFSLLLFSQVSLASGPLSSIIKSEGAGYGIEYSEDKALEVARSWANKRAQDMTEKVLDEKYYQEGFFPIDEKQPYCQAQVETSSSSCELAAEGLVRCDYSAKYQCRQSMWHEDQ